MKIYKITSENRKRGTRRQTNSYGSFEIAEKEFNDLVKCNPNTDFKLWNKETGETYKEVRR